MAVSDLAGEVAVVTGAAQGIGEAIARALAEAGARVAVTARDAPRARRVAESLGPEHAGVALDVADRVSVELAAEEIAARLGEATVLVNNAGVNRIGPFEAVSEEDWSFVLDVNLGGAYRCSQVFGTRMLAAGHGVIVNVASVTGALVGMPGRAAYAASKAGMVGLTRVLATEWSGRGIRVNAVLPGPVRTPMVEKAMADGILVESDIVARIPSGRLATPDDIGRAVALLASPAAGFVTGQTLVVDGGYTTYGAAGAASRPVGRTSE